jgi:hypothetical protein
LDATGKRDQVRPRQIVPIQDSAGKQTGGGAFIAVGRRQPRQNGGKSFSVPIAKAPRVTVINIVRQGRPSGTKCKIQMRMNGGFAP